MFVPVTHTQIWACFWTSIFHNLAGSSSVCIRFLPFELFYNFYFIFKMNPQMIFLNVDSNIGAKTLILYIVVVILVVLSSMLFACFVSYFFLQITCFNHFQFYSLVIFNFMNEFKKNFKNQRNVNRMLITSDDNRFNVNNKCVRTQNREFIFLILFSYWRLTSNPIISSYLRWKTKLLLPIYCQLYARQVSAH